MRQGHRRGDRLARFRRSDRRRARRSRTRSIPTTAAISSKCSAWAAGWPRRFPPETTQVSAALNYPGTIKAFHYHLHQTDCWTPVKGLLQVALVDLRLGSPTFGARNTMYVGALRPWQVLIPPGVRHGYKVIGTRRGHAGLHDRPFLQSAGRRPHPLQRPRRSTTIGKRSRNKRRHEDSGYRRRRLHRLGVRPAGDRRDRSARGQPR